MLFLAEGKTLEITKQSTTTLTKIIVKIGNYYQNQLFTPNQ